MFAGLRCHLVGRAAGSVCRRDGLTRRCGHPLSLFHHRWEVPAAEPQCHTNPWHGGTQWHRTRSPSAKVFNGVGGRKKKKWFVLSLISELLMVLLETSCAQGAWNMGLGGESCCGKSQGSPASCRGSNSLPPFPALYLWADDKWNRFNRSKLKGVHLRAACLLRKVDSQSRSVSWDMEILRLAVNDPPSKSKVEGVWFQPHINTWVLHFLFSKTH